MHLSRSFLLKQTRFVGAWLIGARSFPAGTYSPSTNRYYLPIMDSCMGKMGDTPARFLALDLNTLKFAWDVRTRVPQSSGALSTAGGLVFRQRRIDISALSTIATARCCGRVHG
jgi:hypothetical protein